MELTKEEAEELITLIKEYRDYMGDESYAIHLAAAIYRIFAKKEVLN